MKLVPFTLAAAALLVAGASLWRQHWLSERLMRLEMQVASTPPPVILRVVEQLPAPPVASIVPPPPAKPLAQKLQAQIHPPRPRVELPKCDPTDPKCGL